MPEPSRGVLESLESFEQLPNRILEAILEGLAKKPEDFAILGLGFFAGYEGYDVLAHFFSGFGLMKLEEQTASDIITRAASGPAGFIMPQALVDIAKLSMFPGLAIGDIIGGKVHEILHPQKTDQQIADDPSKTEDQKKLDIYIHDLKARMVMGALGAIAAYTITRPGFISGIGEIVKGVGEIVPG